MSEAVEQLFLQACALNALEPVIARTTISNRDWQIDCTIQNRCFSICQDGRDGFVILEQLDAKYIPFDQGDSEPIFISTQEACVRAAMTILAALKDPAFRGFSREVI